MYCIVFHMQKQKRIHTEHLRGYLSTYRRTQTILSLYLSHSSAYAFSYMFLRYCHTFVWLRQPTHPFTMPISLPGKNEIPIERAPTTHIAYQKHFRHHHGKLCTVQCALDQCILYEHYRGGYIISVENSEVLTEFPFFSVVTVAVAFADGASLLYVVQSCEKDRTPNVDTHTPTHRHAHTMKTTNVQNITSACMKKRETTSKSETGRTI